jgi:hypothetical protein
MRFNLKKYKAKKNNEIIYLNNYFIINYFLIMAELYHYQILILLLYILFIESNCQMILPLKYFPENKYNNSSPLEFINNIIRQKVYADIYIGTPKTEIQIPLDFTTNEFYIYDRPKYESNKSFSDIKYYNSSKSTTYKIVEEYDGEIYNGYSFDSAFYKQDLFYFNDIENMINFYEPFAGGDTTGGIGMKLGPDNSDVYSAQKRERSFFEQMKKNYDVSSFYWTIFFDSIKTEKIEDNGYLLIGCMPHEIDNKADFGYFKGYNFQEKYIKTVNLENPDMSDIKFKVDNLIGYYGKNQNNLIKDFDGKNYLNLVLDYNSGMIKASNHFLKYYYEPFKSLISSEICFTNKNTSFYCKKGYDNAINKLKETLPGIIFKCNDFDYNFTLEADDLFYERDDYIYFLINFGTMYFPEWKMGKPFLRKYPLTFNFDQKVIHFYNIIEEKDPDKGIPTYILIISIVVTAVLVGLIFLVVFKFCLYEKYFRKKRANELTDDDFEYTSKDDENKNNEKNKLGISDNE